VPRPSPCSPRRLPPARNYVASCSTRQEKKE
jgi:hypothetical protein